MKNNPVPFTRDAKEAIHRARGYAVAENYRAVNSSDLLLSLTEEKEVAFILNKLSYNTRLALEKIREGILFQSAIPNDDIETSSGDEAASFRFILSRAQANADRLELKQVTVSLLFHAILGDRKSPVSLIVNKAGLDRVEIRQYINASKGMVPFYIDEVLSWERVADGSETLPHQSSAPVRVEERGGKLVQVSERTSAIDADELDFDRWRAPVAEGLRNLLESDLGPGTNHERLRRRLLALAEALAGAIEEVKANQFRLGYGIESLGDLVGVYRDAADDMPTLNAAVFADVNRLHIQLMLGMSKLVAWQRFQRDADEDQLHEGAADAEVVRAALDQGADVLESDTAKPIVDSELPASFRWLRGAIADPVGTTRRMRYGAVKSFENVVVFLGQISLRSLKETADTVAHGISKAVAAGLLLALADAALRLSAALPTEWGWLKPLLEAAAKVLHG